jgi:hypothetical protein
MLEHAYYNTTLIPVTTSKLGTVLDDHTFDVEIVQVRKESDVYVVVIRRYTKAYTIDLPTLFLLHNEKGGVRTFKSLRAITNWLRLNRFDQARFIIAS